MTKSLENVFAEAAELPEEAQDRIATHLLQERAATGFAGGLPMRDEWELQEKKREKEYG